MKIIHILCGKANPQIKANGVNVVVDQYAQIMHKDGLDIEVWGIANNPITNLPNPKYPIRFFQQYHSWHCKLDNKLIECIKTIDTASTVIHFHGGFIRDFPRIVKIVKGLKYFVMPHHIYSDAALSNRWWRKKMYLSIIEAEFIQKSKGLLVYNENEIGEKCRIYFSNVPIHLISKGPDPKFACDQYVSVKKNKNEVIWGFCGRIQDEHKGVDRMIRSFLKFQALRRNEMHVLSIIGDGPDLKRIRNKYISESDRGLVIFHGRLSEQKKIEEYKRMDFFLHPSNYDTIPLTCLDALAMGIPLLVTPGTLLDNDVINYNAGVVAEPNEQAITQAMTKLINLEHHDMFIGCQRLISEKYDWKKGCVQLKKLYRKVL